MPANVCLVRGVSKTDTITNKRWFGFYGVERNLKAFCESKTFVSKYAQNQKFQYVRINKVLHLLRFPYAAVFDEPTSEELHDAFTNGMSLLSYAQDHYKELTSLSRYGDKWTILDAIWEFFFGLMDEEDFQTVTSLDPKKVKKAFKLHKKIKKNIKSQIGQTAVNPDYPVSDLICALGYDGWLRVASYEEKKDNELRR